MTTVRLGIGITTHNRPEVLAHTLERIREFTPGAKIVVVDDASDVPVTGAYRFDKNVGIARAKNKCLELLAPDCDELFLFDDDCYPRCDDWWLPYVESPEPHLMRIFLDLAGPNKLHDTAEVHRDSRHVAYTSPRGCMLYVNRKVLDVVGGMDVRFGRWGYEHGNWSNRIHCAGLTSWRFGDVVDSEKLVHSMDEYEELPARSVDHATRTSLLEPNRALYLVDYHSSGYCEYREQRDVVLTCLFTRQVDPQRGVRMKPDAGLLTVLLDTLRGQDAVVLHDELTPPDRDGVTWERVETSLMPYRQRVLSQWQWLRDHPEVRYVWAVDGTDVRMLNNPFPNMRPGVLYVGSENTIVGCPWMREHYPHAEMRQLFEVCGGDQLLNAGLVGGDRETVMDLYAEMNRIFYDNAIKLTQGTEKHVMETDMGPLNLVLHSGRWAGRVVFGPQVNTVFKAHELFSDYSWFAHK